MWPSWPSQVTWGGCREKHPISTTAIQAWPSLFILVWCDVCAVSWVAGAIGMPNLAAQFYSYTFNKVSSQLQYSSIGCSVIIRNKFLFYTVNISGESGRIHDLWPYPFVFSSSCNTQDVALELLSLILCLGALTLLHGLVLCMLFP